MQQKILYFAKQEFLNYGFKDASLRNIAAVAGMYKNALFEAIVNPVCDEVEDIFEELSASYYDSDTIIGDITFQNSLDDLHFVYDFIYKNFDVLRLLVVRADGSSRFDFVHIIVVQEVKHTLAYLE